MALDKSRLQALAAYRILDTAPEKGFDDIAELAAFICNTPVALVSLVDDDRQWFKAKVGFAEEQTDISTSVCAFTMLEDDLLVIPDLRRDSRTADMHLVTCSPNIRFYAGAPLRTASGIGIGSLCVIDTEPRPEGLTGPQAEALRRLAGQVMAQMELRRSEQDRRNEGQRYQQILQSAIDFAIIATDLNGHITEWNSGAENIMGWSKAEMTGSTAERFFTEEDRQAGRMQTEMALCGAGHGVSDERWHLRKNGQRFWASGEMMRLFDAGQQHIGYIKILRDRTAEHRAGQALQHAEANLRLAQAAGNVGVFWVGIADRLIHTTPEFCRLYGVPDQSIYPATTFENIVLTDDQHLASSAESRTQGVAPLDVEYRIRRPDTGTIRWISRRGTFEHDATGRPVRFVGVARDITEMVQARDELTAEKEQLRLLNANLENLVAERTADRNGLWQLSSDLMLRCSFDGKIIAGNPAWFEILGWSEADIVGASLIDFLHPDDVEQTMLSARALSQGMSHSRFDNRYRTKAGTYRWISWSARAGDNLINAVGRDMTADRDAQQSLEVAQDALRQSQKMEAVGQLTGGLAHDFNNLLAGITGALDLLQIRIAQGRLAEVDRYVATAQGAARRAAALTHRLLAFSRRQTLDPRPVDVNRLMSEFEDMLRRTIGVEITLEVVKAAGVWQTLVDPHQLENALLNLCINARDAMPSGGRITIESANKMLDASAASQRDLKVGQYVAVSVTDNGVGMDKDVISKVFEPFFTTKPIGQGTGLGLSMVYGFARQSGGQVRVYSEEQLGTTVCLYLPRHHGDEAVRIEHVDVLSPLRPGSGETVLVVDDEPTVRVLITEILHDLGYFVIEAADSAVGLEILNSGARIDLLISDVGLPGGLNGRQMADAARRTRPELKVLFITGYAENSLIGNGHLEPGMQVLSKPFSVDTLSKKIGMLL